MGSQMLRVFLIQLTVYALCSHFFWSASAVADQLSSDGSCSCGGKRDGSFDELKFDGSVHDADDPLIKNDQQDELGVQSEIAITATTDFSSHASDAIEPSEIPADSTVSMTISENMAFIDGGLFYMGTDNPSIHTDGEGPKRMVNLTDFMIDRLITHSVFATVVNFCISHLNAVTSTIENHDLTIYQI
jgi:hypothetical protein